MQGFSNLREPEILLSWDNIPETMPVFIFHPSVKTEKVKSPKMEIAAHSYQDKNLSSKSFTEVCLWQ